MTDLEAWLEEAKEIVKPITQGSDITGRYQDVEKEAMGTILEAVDELVLHFDTMPEGCKCEGKECPAWQYGYDEGYQEGLQDEPS